MNEGDLIRIWVIGSLTAVSILLTLFALSLPPNPRYEPFLFLFPQLYYLPIILISVWYPRRGVQATVLIVAAFLMISAYFYSLGTNVDPFISGLNAALFLWVMVATTHLTESEGGSFFSGKKHKTSEAAYTPISCTEEEISPQELRKTATKLQNFLDSSQDVIFMLDESGSFLRFHWAKISECGLCAEDMVGTRISDICTPTESALYLHRIGEVIDGNKTVSFTSNLDINGYQTEFSTIMSPIYDPEGGTLGVIGSMRNASLYQQDTGVSLERQNDLIRWRNFVNVTAHELRTPLQPILGYLHLILEDKSSSSLHPDTLKLLNLCLESVERERVMVDRMLELGMLDTCTVHLNTRDVDIIQLIDIITQIGGYHLKAEIVVDIPSGTQIRADRDRLYQVLDGIIANAVQYNTEPKNVWITYTENAESHILSVADDGIGIAREAQDAIFEPFYLTNLDHLSREYGRIGLGLSIARRYIEVHGGDISVESEPGKGSTFIIRLPKEADE